MCFGCTVSPTVALWRCYIYFVSYKSCYRTLLRFGLTVDENLIHKSIFNKAYIHIQLTVRCGLLCQRSFIFTGSTMIWKCEISNCFRKFRNTELSVTERTFAIISSASGLVVAETVVRRSLYRAGRFVFHFPPDFTPGRERPWPVFGAGLLPQRGSKPASPWQPKMRPCPVLSEPLRHVLFHPCRCLASK